MKHFRWMAAIVVAALVLSACGSMQEATIDSQLEIGLLAVQDGEIPASDPQYASLATPAAWEAYGLSEHGEVWECWQLQTREPDHVDGLFVVDYPTQGYDYWRLVAVTLAEKHVLFENVNGPDQLEGTAGWLQAIGCKLDEVVEEPEWCSPGFWRNSPIAAGEAADFGGFALSELYSAHFTALTGLNERTLDRLGLPADPTLQQVLDNPQAYGGPAFNNVGDLLSGAHPDVNFTGERVSDSCPLSADASRRS